MQYTGAQVNQLHVMWWYIDWLNIAGLSFSTSDTGIRPREKTTYGDTPLSTSIDLKGSVVVRAKDSPIQHIPYVPADRLSPSTTRPKLLVEGICNNSIALYSKY